MASFATKFETSTAVFSMELECIVCVYKHILKRCLKTYRFRKSPMALEKIGVSRTKLSYKGPASLFPSCCPSKIQHGVYLPYFHIGATKERDRSILILICHFLNSMSATFCFGYFNFKVTKTNS